MRFRKNTRLCIWTFSLRVLCWLAALILLVGCAAEGEEIVENEPIVVETATVLSTLPVATVSPTDEVTMTATHLPVSTSAPTATATTTPTPTFTPAPTATRTPTLTLLPTVEPDLRGLGYRELMQSNGGCQLPCWWGFELGATSAGEILQFYEAFGTYIADRHEYGKLVSIFILFNDPEIEGGWQVVHDYVVQDDIVVEAKIEMVDASNYQIRALLNELGQPAEVWLWTIPEPFEGSLPLFLDLYFPDRGVLVQYAVTAARVGDHVQTCFDSEGGTLLNLWNPAIWDPNREKSLAQRVADFGLSVALEGHLPLVEASNWDEQLLFESLTNPANSGCLETSAELWPHP